MSPNDAHSRTWQAGIGYAVALAALALGWATWQLPASDATDGGARLVPGLCAAALLLCGACLVWEARQGGWRSMPAKPTEGTVNWRAGVWVSAGLLLAALVVRYSGFVLAAALCYVLALQGLRLAQQPKLQLQLQGKRLLVDVITGLAVAGVVYALMTHVLGVALPAGRLSWM